MVAARGGASTLTRSSSEANSERGNVVNVVLMGPPGAGKGTQAGTVASLVGVTHVASGDLLRELVKADTVQARQVKAYMDRGDLVPDELTLAIVMDRLSQTDTLNGFILDGFPRTVPQARALDDQLEASDRQIDRVINLVVPGGRAVGTASLGAGCAATATQATTPCSVHPKRRVSVTAVAARSISARTIRCRRRVGGSKCTSTIRCRCWSTIGRSMNWLTYQEMDR